VYDRVRASRLERGVERARLLEVEAHLREAGRGRGAAHAADDVVARGQKRGQTPADQPAGARDQQPLLQPAITAPPLTQSTSPQT
jgi:hypothetical protein